MLVIIGLVAVLLTVLLIKFNNSPLLRPLAVPLRTGFVYIQGNERRADFGLRCLMLHNHVWISQSCGFP